MSNNTKYNIEISDEELNKYLISSRACKLTNGCILEPKKGRVVLDLSSLGKIKAICLHTQKLSGNGLLTWKINNQEPTNISVSSKISQNFEIESETITTIELTRPATSVGEVRIFGLSLQQEEGSELSLRWKYLIAKCGNYAHLRQVGEKLFASEGAFIENGSVVSKLETAPPGFFSRVNDTIKFLGPCEIATLEVSEAPTTTTPTNRNLYTHLEAPTPVLPVQVPVVPEPVLHLVETSVAVFDSQLFRPFERDKGLHLLNKQAKLINSNAKDYLVLKRGGVFTIPMSGIQANSEYQIETTIQKLNGNGKIHIGFLSEQNSHPPKTEILLAESSVRSVEVKLQSDSGNSFKLQFSMQEDGSGEVLVSRLIVNKKIQQYLPYPLVTASYQSESNTIDGEQPSTVSSVRIDTKHAAVLEIQPNLLSYSYPTIDGSIEATSFGGKLWLSRVLGLFPGIKASKLNPSHWSTGRPPDVLLTSLDTLKPSSRIWLEEYTGKITSAQLQILLQAQHILTPSLPNSLELKTLCGPDKVSLCSLAFPFEKLSNQPDNYILYFEKSPVQTGVLLRAWKSTYPKLMVVGTGCKLPSHVIPISEYHPYRKLLDLIARSQLVIEFSDNSNYQSGLIDLCQQLPVKVVTDNHHYILKNNVQIIRSCPVGSIRLPDEDSLTQALASCLKAELKPVSNSDYEKTILDTMLKLLGKPC